MSGTNSIPTPASQPQPKVKLCIQSQNGDKSYYRTRSDKRIKRLLMAYCEDKNIDYGATAFIYEDKRIIATRTPDEIGLKDGDEIEAFHQQTGGASHL